MWRGALFAGAAALMVADMARADFYVSFTTTPGTGIFAGDDVIQYKVQNSGQGLTAGTKKLLALDVTMSSPDPNPRFFIRTFDSTGGSETTPSDADLANQGGETPSGSYVRAGSATGFTIVSTNPNYLGPDSGAAPTNPTRYVDGQSLPSIQVIGSPGLTTGGVDDETPIVFAQAVVPHGQFVCLTGQFGAETGTPLPFTCGPEPSTLGWLVPGLALAVNRRRSGRIVI